jgi:hypothetical protein
MKTPYCTVLLYSGHGRAKLETAKNFADEHSSMRTKVTPSEIASVRHSQ